MNIPQELVNRLNKYSQHREKKKTHVYERIIHNKTLESEIKELSNAEEKSNV